MERIEKWSWEVWCFQSPLNECAGKVAVILAGGLGTRLRNIVADRPKPMAEVGSKPFLGYLIERLLSYHISNVILCVGYMKDKIISHFTHKYGALITFAKEDSPLGTGGALKNAEKYLPRDRFLVLNGDTYASINYNNLISFHRRNQADLTMGLVEVSGSRYGRVKLRGNLVTEFVEKEVATGFVNAGVYVFERRVLDLIPSRTPYSIENELMPLLISSGRKLLGYKTNCDFIDIGEPESYRFLLQNQELLKH